VSPDGAQPVDDGSAGPPGQEAGDSGEYAGGPDAGFGGPGEPSEEELRAAYEAELSRLSTTDVMAQAVVSLLNLGARRLGPPGGEQVASDLGGAGASTHPERDLEQARDAIDAVRALLEVLERRLPRELAPLRDALSRLQMAYAREVGAGAPVGAAGAPAGAPASAPAGPAGTGGGAAPGPSQAPSEGSGGGPAPAPGEQSKGPGPAESSGRLWVPGR
jgi:hypothetical protein